MFNAVCFARPVIPYSRKLTHNDFNVKEINANEDQQEALLGLEKSHISKIYEACHTCYTVVQNLNMPHLLNEK